MRSRVRWLARTGAAVTRAPLQWPRAPQQQRQQQAWAGREGDEGESAGDDGVYGRGLAGSCRARSRIVAPRGSALRASPRRHCTRRRGWRGVWRSFAQALRSEGAARRCAVRRCVRDAVGRRLRVEGEGGDGSRGMEGCVALSASGGVCECVVLEGGRSCGRVLPASVCVCCEDDDGARIPAMPAKTRSLAPAWPSPSAIRLALYREYTVHAPPCHWRPVPRIPGDTSWAAAPSDARSNVASTSHQAGELLRDANPPPPAASDNGLRQQSTCQRRPHAPAHGLQKQPVLFSCPRGRANPVLHPSAAVHDGNGCPSAWHNRPIRFRPPRNALCDRPSPFHTPPSKLARDMCALVTAHCVPLPRAPSLASCVIRSRVAVLCSLQPPTWRGFPRGAQVTLHKDPDALPQVPHVWAQKRQKTCTFNKHSRHADAVRPSSIIRPFPPLESATCFSRLAPNVYPDAKRLLPLSLLPNRKKRIGNL
ncbi:hypothetical protein PSPO01_10018 [Paraphaeosphaeria sporulosa]